MPTPAAATGAPATQFFRLRGVNLFASGEYRGKRWSPADVRQMAENAAALGPRGRNLLVPPAAPGHEDDAGWQNFVGDVSAPGNDRTDEPAAGWVDPSTVRAVPDPAHRGEMILKGDVVNVPAAMAEQIRSGRYRYGSSEIYEDFLDDFGKGHGRTLRKFSYLGGEVPQVKRLGPLPPPEPMPAPVKFAERRPGVFVRTRTVRTGSAVHTYAETTVMDRSQMIAAIQAAMPSLSQSFLDALADDKLAELVAALPSGAAAAPPASPAAPAMPGPVGMMAEGDPAEGGGDPAAEPTRDEMIAALVDMGDDEAELQGLSDDELKAEYEAAMEDGGEETPDPETEDMADPAALDRAGLIAELTAAGQDPAALDPLTDDELRALYDQVVNGATPAEPAAAPPAAPMGEKRPMQTYAERRGRRQPQPVTTLAEIEARRTIVSCRKLTKLSEQQARRIRKTAAELKARDTEQFCEQQVREGRYTPAMVQTVVKPLLAKCDDTLPVFTFSDGGRTRKVTEYELKKAELAKAPKVVHLGERFPGGSGPATTAEAERQKVERFAEVQGEALKKAGTTKAQFVAKFSEAQKRRPDLRAEEYLGPDAAKYA